MGRPAKDYTGEHIGNLIILERCGNTADGHAQWKCECQCENKTIVYKSSNQLVAAKKAKKQISCGCLVSKLISENPNRYFIDLTDQRFGKLVAKEVIGSTGQSKLWRCECDCGNKNFITTSHHLRTGNTQSCGCLKSTGELIIQNILIENQIPFIKEKQFEDLIFKDSNGKPRFDFYLPEYNRLIEFDGTQHFYENSFWSTQESLETIKQRDQEKNQWAKEHNISLVRIPYWERDNITLDMILGDKYLVG